MRLTAWGLRKGCIFCPQSLERILHGLDIYIEGVLNKVLNATLMKVQIINEGLG